MRKTSRQTILEAEKLGVNLDDVKGELLDGIETVRPAHVRDHKKELDESTPNTPEVEPVVSDEQLAIQEESDATKGVRDAEAALESAKARHAAATRKKAVYRRNLTLAEIEAITRARRNKKLGKTN